VTTAQPPGHEAGQGDDDLDARRAEAAAKLSELMAKLRDAQSRLDTMIAESRKLQEKLREVRIEEDGPSPNRT
jgi:F0F1-type ATP synthase membrane subunit b/b'